MVRRMFGERHCFQKDWHWPMGRLVLGGMVRYNNKKQVDQVTSVPKTCIVKAAGILILQPEFLCAFINRFDDVIC